jgi:hypothetical protein
MEQSPSWEVTQEILCLLWNPKVHYHVHMSLPLVPVLWQMHPIHTFPPYIPKIHSNIILPSVPRSSEWPSPSGFPTKIIYILLIFPMWATWPAHFIQSHFSYLFVQQRPSFHFLYCLLMMFQLLKLCGGEWLVNDELGTQEREIM